MDDLHPQAEPVRGHRYTFPSPVQATYLINDTSRQHHTWESGTFYSGRYVRWDPARNAHLFEGELEPTGEPCIFLLAALQLEGRPESDSATSDAEAETVDDSREESAEKDEPLDTPPSARDWSKWPEPGTAVTYWSERALRYVFQPLQGGRDEYVALWRVGLLEHQREKRAKPAHLPSPEELGVS